MKITIIGGGVMGEIITRSILNKNIATSQQIIVIEIDDAKRKHFSKKYEVKTTKSAKKAICKSNLIILCLRPQGTQKILKELKGHIESSALVISIMAGIEIKDLKNLIDHKHIIRSMPNISSRIGKGMTVWYASTTIPLLELLLAKMIFQSFGLEEQVYDEKLINAATAISGSGPAYIFYLAEKFIKSSESLGFSHKESQRMIKQTFQGAMDLWDETNLSPHTLRKMVTSKKGTTDAAIKSFEKSDTGSVMNNAVKAAYNRSKELGKETNS